MLQLILIIIGLLAISFLCSVLESVVLSITRPYIQTLVEKKNRSGPILQDMKENIDEPIAAILTLNTISHTAGATVSGAMALSLFGSEWMALFSAILTFLILIFSEIIPKTLGAFYWKNLGPVSAYILKIMILLLKPIIIPIHFLSGLLSKNRPGTLISKGEIYNFVRMGHAQGALGSSEFELIDNILTLEKIKVKKIMTPRTIVFSLAPDMTVKQVKEQKKGAAFSRIPLYNGADNIVEGVVLRRDIMDRIAQDKLNVTMKSLSKKPEFVPESMSVFKLLDRLVSAKVHLAVVLNEYGDYTGIVTMEDAVETLLGVEIVDEFDTVTDMRELAREKGKAVKGKKSRGGR